MIFFEQNYFFEYYTEKEQIEVPAQLITLIPFVNPSLYLNLKFIYDYTSNFGLRLF